MSNQRAGATVPGKAARPPTEVAVAGYYAMMTADFSGIYSVNVAAADERLKVLKLSLTFLSAPFVAGVALLSAKVFDPSTLNQWETIPSYVYLLVLCFGLLSITPFLRFIEANATHMRTARALNNFRLLYSRGLLPVLSVTDWKPNLPVDPQYPETYAPSTWPGINIMILGTLNSAYIAMGVIGLTIKRPNLILVLTVTFALAVAHFLIYYIRSNVSRKSRMPENIMAAEVVET